MDVDQRLWARVSKTPTCWLWTAAVTANGYGELMIDGRMWTAHRLSWTIANGPIPDGLYVLHHCDVRHCVRPDHLYIGTAAQNSKDAVERGRATGGSSPGEINPNHRLTEAGVREIREMAAAGTPQPQIAAAFGVTQACVSSVVTRRTWRHVA